MVDPYVYLWQIPLYIYGRSLCIFMVDPYVYFMVDPCVYFMVGPYVYFMVDLYVYLW